MSAKARSASVDYLVYLAVRICICIVQALPFPMACRFADFFAWLLYHIDRRHREVALENLRCAFPGEYTERQLDRLVRKVYRHFCLMLVEILFLPRLVHERNWTGLLHYRTEEEAGRMVDLFISGRPVLMASGHFGNWEVSSHVLGLLGIHLYGIARPLDNPYLDNWLRRLRQAQGQTMLAKKGDFEQMREVLARGGVLGTLADQDAGRRGLFVNFFNRPASTHKAVALLALEYNVPIAVIAAARLDQPLKYLGMVEDFIEPKDYAGRPEAVFEITQRFTTALERMIRKFPEQYFWLHRRWKHQPVIAKKMKLSDMASGGRKPAERERVQALRV